MTEEKTALEEQEVEKVEEIVENQGEEVTTSPEIDESNPVQEVEQPAPTDEEKQATEEATEAEVIEATETTEEAPAEAPAPTTEETEKTEGKPEETAEEKPEEKAEEKPQAQPETQAEGVEKKTPIPMECVYRTALATYTDAQALNFLRKKIYGYQEIDEDFLKKVAEDGAFKTEMKYISIVRCNSNVHYTWETATKDGEKHAHKEEKTLSKDFCDDVVELNPFDLGAAKTIDLDNPREDEKMLAKKSYSLAKAKKDFNAVIKQASPNKAAKFEKITERYETIYVPVLKTSCVFEGETYLGYVNLLNGACVSEYRVSARLQDAVNTAMGKAKSAKGALIHSLVFLLLLCIMSLGKAFYNGISSLNVPVLWTGVIMGAAAIVPILCLGVASKYKPDQMKEGAVQTGKMPTAKGAKWLVLLNWVICAAAVVVFFLKAVV